MSDKSSVAADLSSSARQLLNKHEATFFAGDGKEPRNYTKAEALSFLNDINHRTLNNYCKQLGIDPKRHEDSEWRVDIHELYAIREQLPAQKRKAPKFQRGRKKTQVITIGNQKGGVGKTTVAVTLASGLATEYYQEYRVGLIDLDGQANATKYYKADHEIIGTVGDLLIKNYDLDEGETHQDFIRECFLPTSIPNLRILPTAQRDRGIDSWFFNNMASLENIYGVLDEVIDAVRDEFDIIIIDTSPALSFTTLNAYFAATSVIYPIGASDNDIKATAGYFMYIDGVSNRLIEAGHKGNDFTKLLVTNYAGDSASVDARAVIERSFGDHVYSTEFKHSVAIKECASFSCTVFDISKSEYPKTKTTFKNAVDNAYAVVSKIHSDIEKVWRKR